MAIEADRIQDGAIVIEDGADKDCCCDGPEDTPCVCGCSTLPTGAAGQLSACVFEVAVSFNQFGFIVDFDLYSSKMHTWLRRAGLAPNVDYLVWAGEDVDLTGNAGTSGAVVTYRCCHAAGSSCDSPAGGVWDENTNYIGWGDCSGFAFGMVDSNDIPTGAQEHQDTAPNCIDCGDNLSTFLDGEEYGVDATYTIKTSDIPRNTWVDKNVLFYDGYPTHAVCGVGGYCIPESIEVSNDGTTESCTIDNGGFLFPAHDGTSTSSYYANGTPLTHSGGRFIVTTGMTFLTIEDQWEGTSVDISQDMWTRSGSGMLNGSLVTVTRGNTAASGTDQPYAMQPPRFYLIEAIVGGSGDEYLVQGFGNLTDSEAWKGLPGGGGSKYELKRTSATQCSFQEFDYATTTTIDFAVNEQSTAFTTVNGDYTISEWWPQEASGGTP